MVPSGLAMTPLGPCPARLTLDAGHIARIEPASVPDGPLILPGFIDLHCHGGRDD